MPLDLAAAARFLTLLDPTTDKFHFRRLHNTPGNPGLNAHGTLAGCAPRLDSPDHGAFVVINSGGQKKADITRIRAFYADYDEPGAGLERMARCPFPPSMVVESSPGKYHGYWLVDGFPEGKGVDAQYRPLLVGFIKHMGSDRGASDTARVLRVPGFTHSKGAAFTTRLVNSDGHRYNAAQFLPWLASVMPAPVPREPDAPLSDPTSASEAYARDVTDRAAREIAEAAEGERNTTLTRVAIYPLGLAKGGHIPADDVRQILSAAAAAAGMDDGEIQQTLNSSYKAATPKGPPTPAVDCAAAFISAQPADQFKAFLARVQAEGGLVENMRPLLDETIAGGFSPEQRDQIRVVLKDALRSNKMFDKAIGRRIDDALTPKRPHGPAASATLAEHTDTSAVPDRRLATPTGVHAVDAVNASTEIFGGRMAVQHGACRWWSGREWQAVPAARLEWLLFAALMPDHAKAHAMAGTRQALLAYLPELPAAKRDTRAYYRNGVCDFATGALVAHTADNHNIGTLAADYAPQGAPTPQWDTFLHQLFGGLDDGTDRITLLQEMFGWLLMSGDLNVQKIMVLDGASRGGKGVILSVLRKLLGSRCGETNFRNFDDGKTQSAVRKYDVVIDRDAKSPPRQNINGAIGFMNKLASSEGFSIQLLHKQDPWEGELSTKLVLACNGLPALIDDSGATTNRMLVLQFTRSFEGREDRGLLARLLLELDGVAAWAAVGARRLVANGGVFASPASTIEATQAMRSTNQPLLDFIEAALVFDVDARVLSRDIWATWRLYAADNGMASGSSNSFGRNLKKTMTSMSAQYKAKLAVGGKVSSGYMGLALRDAPFGPEGGNVHPITAPGAKQE